MAGIVHIFYLISFLIISLTQFEASHNYYGNTHYIRPRSQDSDTRSRFWSCEILVIQVNVFILTLFYFEVILIFEI